MARGDAVAEFGVDFDAGVGVDGAAGDESSRTEALDSPADGGGVDGGEEAGDFGAEGAGGGRLVKGFGVGEDAGVAALGCDDCEPGFFCGAGAKEFVGEDGAGLGGGSVVGEVEHPPGEDVGEFDEVGGESVAAVLEDVDALEDFEPVAGVAPDGLGVIGEEGDGAGAGGFAGFDHEAGEQEGVFLALHEGAGAGFDVEDEGVEALGELFAHDAGGDEVRGFDRTGVVAESVEDAVGGDEVRGLADKAGAALAEDLLEARERELGVEAGDGFELVQGSAGVTERTAGDHGDADPGDAGGCGCGEAGGGEDGSDEEGGLVADAAGGVLVDGEGVEGCSVEGLAGEAHGLGEGGEFLGVEAVLEDRHEEGGGLGFGDFVVGEGVDEGLDLFVGEDFVVAFVADEVLRMEGCHASWKADGRRSARVQVVDPAGAG